MAVFTTRPEIRGTFGAVASTHWLASAVGMSMLEKGGNAFDAAAAAGFTLQVVEPHLNGPLGEAPILVWSEANRRCDMICGQGVAPAAATIDHFRGLGLDLIPGTGLLAATVPGAFGAWMRLLRDWGTMPLAEILMPAIAYAENGYPVVERISETIAAMAEMFRREWPSSAAVYLPHGGPPSPGRLFRNPALAATYRRMLAEAGEGAARARSSAPARVVPGLCRRGDRSVLPAREGARFLRAAAWRAADRRRFGALGSAGRNAGHLRLSWLDRGQGRPVEPGAGSAADPGAAAGVRSRRSRSARAGFCPHRRRMPEARLCRPRGLVRRSRFRRCADATLLERRLQRRPAQAGRRPRLDRAAPGQPRWPDAAGAGRRAGGDRRAGIGEPTVGGIGEPTVDPRASSPATPAMSMSSTAGATWSRRRRGAAGCKARRSFPNWAFASGRGCRCSGSKRGCRRASAGQAPAQHLVAVDGVQGRRARTRFRHAGRRPAGPMVGADVPAPRPPRHEPAGGDRLSGLSHRAQAELVLSARRPSRPGGVEDRFPEATRAALAGAAIAWWSADHGRKAASRPAPAKKPRRPRPQSRRQPPRHARLRHRALRRKVLWPRPVSRRRRPGFRRRANKSTGSPP